MTVWPKNFIQVGVDMSRREDVGERVGSFVRQMAAGLCRPHFWSRNYQMYQDI